MVLCTAKSLYNHSDKEIIASGNPLSRNHLAVEILDCVIRPRIESTNIFQFSQNMETSPNLQDGVCEKERTSSLCMHHIRIAFSSFYNNDGAHAECVRELHGDGDCWCTANTAENLRERGHILRLNQSFRFPYYLVYKQLKQRYLIFNAALTRRSLYGTSLTLKHRLLQISNGLYE